VYGNSREQLTPGLLHINCRTVTTFETTYTPLFSSKRMGSFT
jgi:hypothetical protein